MFQPQPTPYAHFASYGAPNSVPEYNFQSPSFAPNLGLDSGGPIIFDNPAFSPVGNNFPTLNANLHPPYNNTMNTPPSDDMAAQEALARQYQPDLKGPLVGDKKSSHAITEEYAKADPVYVAKTSTLPQTYSHYRPILGDGNCGWRAIAFSYFETLAQLRNKDQVEEEIGRMMSLTSFITTMCGHEEWIFEDMRDETLDILRALADAMQSNPSTNLTSLVLESMNDPEKSNAIVYYCRLLASAWLKAHPSTYSGFIPDGLGVDNYCKDVIEPTNTEIEHLGMTLLIDVLLKPVGFAVEIVYLDRSSGTHVNTHLHQAEDENGVPTNPTGPIIHLLYRPGHYDILYKDASPVSTTLRQHVLDNAGNHSNIQVNRAMSLDRHNVIENTAMSRIGEYSGVDITTLADIPGFSLGPMPSHHGFPAAFGSVGDYQPLASPTYSMEPSTVTGPPISPSAISPVSSVPPVYPAASSTLPIHSLSTDMGSARSSQFRHSKYEYETDWNEAPAPTFQTSTFKNSHYNTAHYNNPNFQPEEWNPDCEEALGREKRETGRHKST